jgi:MFS family permease
MTSIIAARAFGGLFSAGGSVTLGIVADLFDPQAQEHPLAYIVLSSVGGSIIGPIMGGYVQTYLPWQWTIWLQLIVGVVVQILHFFLVPETRATVRLNAHAAELRKKGVSPTPHGPTEHKTWKQYMMPSEALSIWVRPFSMFVTEPIVSVLSSLSGLSDAIIFMQIQSFGLVFEMWNFTVIQTGLVRTQTRLFNQLPYKTFLLTFLPQGFHFYWHRIFAGISDVYPRYRPEPKTPTRTPRIRICRVRSSTLVAALYGPLSSYRAAHLRVVQYSVPSLGSTDVRMRAHRDR